MKLIEKVCLTLITNLLISFQLSANTPSIEDYIPPFDFWLEISNQNSISTGLVYGMALVESGRYNVKNEFIPWAFAIGVGPESSIGQLKHESLYPATFAEAKEMLHELLAKGHTNLGLGMMQINIAQNPNLVEDPVHLFDPVTNMKAASKIIKQCNRNRTDIEMLSCYSHGRYESVKGAKYAKQVFNFEDRFASSFINKHQPTGELTLNELNYFWYDSKSNKPSKSPIQQVDIVQ
jgi:hypothetical protein